MHIHTSTQDAVTYLNGFLRCLQRQTCNIWLTQMTKYREYQWRRRSTTSTPIAEINFTCHSGLVTQELEKQISVRDSIYRIIVVNPTYQLKQGRQQTKNLLRCKQDQGTITLTFVQVPKRHRPAMVASSILFTILHKTESNLLILSNRIPKLIFPSKEANYIDLIMARWNLPHSADLRRFTS